MILLKHTYNDLDPYNKHEQKLFKNGDNWYKEIHEGYFEEFDIESLKSYIKMYDFVSSPIMMEYDKETNVFKYEIEDLSNTHNQLIDIPYIEQIRILGKILSEVMHSFLEFSIMQGKEDKVFCHRDLAFHNIYVNGDDIKLIDIDSFMWVDRSDFKSHYQYTILKLAQHFDV